MTNTDATKTTTVENVKVGDTLVVGRDRKTVKEVRDLGTSTHLVYDDVAPWGPCDGVFAAINGTEVKVDA